MNSIFRLPGSSCLTPFYLGALHIVLSEQGKPHHCLAGYLTDDFLEFEAYLTVTKNGQFEFLWRDSEKAAESRKAKSKASAKKHRHKQPKLMTEKKKKQRAEQDRTRMQMSDDEDDEEGEMDWEVSTIRGVLTAIRVRAWAPFLTFL